jgi:cysteinyl-tRNA synthetase
MKLYNTATRRIEEIQTIVPKRVGMYICGPTVYNTPTIGNLRTYISQDLLRRTLKYLGYSVNEVMNITDIEDKIIRDSAAQGVPYTELTSKYEKIFLDNLKSLNIEPVESMPHATDPKVITKMIEIISALIDKGFAYKSEDGSVYFSIDKFETYGKLSGLENREVKAGARVAQDEYDKENAQDFALWKAEKEGEPGWEAPFGKGRPGWHIECTAMATMTLGDTIDIHGGGIDLVFPHHENEIAQSEAYTGKKFVNTWFHSGHLLINGQRMGKSLNNFYTLLDLVNKFKVNPLAFRLLTLQSHYRDSLNFTDESIQAAQNTLTGIYDFVTRLKTPSRHSREGVNPDLDALTSKTKLEFSAALADDLNTPKAMASFFGFTRELNKLVTQGLSVSDAKLALSALYNMDKVLGLGLEDVTETTGNDATAKLLLDRETARANKDWQASDEIREEIRKAGFEVEDTANGQRLTKI